MKKITLIVVGLFFHSSFCMKRESTDSFTTNVRTVIKSYHDLCGLAYVTQGNFDEQQYAVSSEALAEYLSRERQQSGIDEEVLSLLCNNMRNFEELTQLIIQEMHEKDANDPWHVARIMLSQQVLKEEVAIDQELHHRAFSYNEKKLVETHAKYCTIMQSIGIAFLTSVIGVFGWSLNRCYFT